MTTIGPPLAGELESIRRLLSDAGLPVEDVRAELLQSFLVLRHEGTLHGTAAVEALGTFGLLRSVAVSQQLRGQGHGKALVRAAEALAVQRGLAPLYLLTTSADGYFAAQGFRRVDRAAVPAAIRESEEFSSLCPQTAIVMVKP